MKILFINTVDLSTNEISTSIINNAKYLANKNYVAIAYSNKLNKKLEKELYSFGIKLIKLPPKKQKPSSVIKKLISVIKWNADIWKRQSKHRKLFSFDNKMSNNIFLS